MVAERLEHESMTLNSCLGELCFPTSQRREGEQKEKENELRKKCKIL